MKIILAMKTKNWNLSMKIPAVQYVQIPVLHQLQPKTSFLVTNFISSSVSSYFSKNVEIVSMLVRFMVISNVYGIASRKSVQSAL